MQGVSFLTLKNRVARGWEGRRGRVLEKKAVALCLVSTTYYSHFI
jgi:hypothetical protein